MQRVIRVGSRESRLAIAQTQLILEGIRRLHPDIRLELVTMKTTGDRILDRSLEAIGGKGLFVRELDRALAAGEIDLAVHSLKDLPMEENPSLPLLAFSEREDPRDVLVLPQGSARWDVSLPVGSSSPRRRAQLLRLYPKARVEMARGNILTRLQKLDDGQYGALLLACAGLRRLGLGGRISHCFSPDELLPAAGQGILAVQGRAGEDYRFLEGVGSRASAAAAQAERAFVRALGGGCTSPVAAYAQPQGRNLWLRGFWQPGERAKTGALVGPVEQAASLGERLAEQLMKGE